MKSSNKWKISTFVGTRPELIRLAEIIRLADAVFEHRLIHTGQNSMDSLNKIFFEELDIRSPDVNFNCNNLSVGKFLSDLFEKTEIEL